MIEILNYNAEHYGFTRAVRYEQFLLERIGELATGPEKGNSVADDPSFRYLIMRKRSRGDGHVAVYRVNMVAQQVEIVSIYHTKQDRPNRLNREEE